MVSCDGKTKVTTPSQTQRGFGKILEQIGTPAADCIARGKPCGRIQGEFALKRESKPVIFKHSKAYKKTDKLILSEFDGTANSSNPKKINALVEIVRSTLKSLQFSTDEFMKKLNDSG